METKKCIGCGSILQCEDINAEGYIPANKIEDSIYCQRCFKLKNYGKKSVDTTLISDDDTIKKVNESNSFAFFLVDFLNISNEIIETYKKIKINKALIISKSDLIIKDIKLDKLKENIKEVYKINEDILFLSSKNNYNIGLIFKELDKYNKKKAYILGYTNAGKSTLINTLREKEDIVTSNSLNTTLDFIKMNINGYEIIDTPGFSLSNTFYKKDDYDLIKKCNPSKFVSPITYKTKKNQIFKINDLYIKNFDDNSITFYMSNLITIDKIYRDEDDNYQEITVKDNSDIVISSLGFINVKKACIFKINKKYSNLISIRESLFK